MSRIMKLLNDEDLLYMLAKIIYMPFYIPALPNIKKPWEWWYQHFFLQSSDNFKFTQMRTLYDSFLDRPSMFLNDPLFETLQIWYCWYLTVWCMFLSIFDERIDSFFWTIQWVQFDDYRLRFLIKYFYSCLILTVISL